MFPVMNWAPQIAYAADMYQASGSGFASPAIGAAATFDRVCRLVPDGTALVVIQTAMPANANGAALIRAGFPPPLYRIPAGELVWLRAAGNADVDGSVEIWPAGAYVDRDSPIAAVVVGG